MQENKYYNEIKDILINNEINKKVKDYFKNKAELESYYNVGKLLFEAGKHYGNGIIKEYSIKLTKELNIKYTKSSLYNMINFYKLFVNFQTLSGKSQTLSDFLSWSHYVELLKFEDINEINYYISQVEEKNLSVRDLRKIIKDKEYERLDESTKEKLKHNEELSIVDEIKNPILINNKSNIDVNNIKEKVLQKIILDDITNFLKQLGNGYAFIDSEYKIKVGNTYNYIDILLYNVIYHCYVVVELKVTPLKKEHIGQIEVYMNNIDFNLKGINDNKTIGLIVVKENNEYIIKYSSDKRIKSLEYEFI